MDQIQRDQVKQQIEQMTGSVRMLKEKEINAVTDQLIREQMGREEVYERRENFLNGRGHTIGDSFAGRVARAGIGEPIEKEPQDKAQKKMNRQIRKQYNASKRRISRDERAQRRSYARDVKYSFIRTQSFATGYQYDILADAKGWMMENPEAYARNREAVDAMYRDLYIADEAYGALSRQSRYYSYAYQEVEDRAMAREVDRRMDLLHDRQSFLQHRVQMLCDGLKALLRGEEVVDAVKETMQEYQNVGLTEQQQQEKARYAEEATHFGTISDNIKDALIPEIMRCRAALEERMGWQRSTPEELAEYAREVYPSSAGRAQNFVDLEDAETITKAAKVIVYRASETRNTEKDDLNADVETRTEAMRYIQEFTTGSMDAMLRVMGDDPTAFVERYRQSDDLLLHDRDQFEMLGYRLQHASDLMKGYKDIVNGSGDELIGDVYMREHNLTAEKIGAMRQMLYALSRRARFLALTRAYRAGVLTADMLSATERYGIGQYEGDELVEQAMDKAKRQLAVADRTMDMAINQYRGRGVQ